MYKLWNNTDSLELYWHAASAPPCGEKKTRGFVELQFGLGPIADFATQAGKLVVKLFREHFLWEDFVFKNIIPTGNIVYS